MYRKGGATISCVCVLSRGSPLLTAVPRRPPKRTNSPLALKGLSTLSSTLRFVYSTFPLRNFQSVQIESTVVRPFKKKWKPKQNQKRRRTKCLSRSPPPLSPLTTTTTSSTYGLSTSSDKIVDFLRKIFRPEKKIQ